MPSLDVVQKKEFPVCSRCQMPIDINSAILLEGKLENIAPRKDPIGSGAYHTQCIVQYIDHRCPVSSLQGAYR